MDKSKYLNILKEIEDALSIFGDDWLGPPSKIDKMRSRPSITDLLASLKNLLQAKDLKQARHSGFSIECMVCKNHGLSSLSLPWSYCYKIIISHCESIEDYKLSACIDVMHECVLSYANKDVVPENNNICNSDELPYLLYGSVFSTRHELIKIAQATEDDNCRLEAFQLLLSMPSIYRFNPETIFKPIVYNEPCEDRVAQMKADLRELGVLYL